MSNQLMQAMEQLQAMQQKMEEAQTALDAKMITEEGGGGIVRVTVNGNGRLVKLELGSEALAGEDREMVEDLLIATINRALETAKKTAAAEMENATQGMMPNIPGLNLPF